MYHVYVIRSSDGKIYTGHTSDMFRRLCEHNTGQCKTTSAGAGWKLIYHEHYKTRGEAMRRERWLKTGAGRSFLQEYMNELTRISL